MIDPAFESALANRLTDAKFPQLPNFERGKVRESYDLPDGRRVMIATDRQSAFDFVLAAVPYKGQVLNQTAKFWFEQPYVMKYVVDTLIEAPDDEDDPLPMTDEDTGFLFLLLKTVVEVLDKAA